MPRPVSVEIRYADYEMGRFIRAQWAEAQRLGFPRQSIYARDIARGTVSLPPVEAEDPAIAAVGEFYHQRLSDIERQLLAAKYIGACPMTRRSLHISARRCRDKVTNALRRCADWLAARGF